MSALPGLTVGDPAPWFLTSSPHSDNQDIVIGGYQAVLSFLGSASQPQTRSVLLDFYQARAEFVEQNIHFFAISIDPNDQVLAQSFESCSHFHMLWDFSGEISIRYQLCQLGQGGKGIAYDPTTFVLDENLRILRVLPLQAGLHAQQTLRYLRSLPAKPLAHQIQQQAPILLIHNVLPPSFCQRLIAGYRQTGGTESGVMQQLGEQTVVTLAPAIKRRRDWLVTEPDLLNSINLALSRRVIPELIKAFQYRATCYERYVVACYEAANQGFFRPHRDNVAQGNQHRRFALTLNLNAGYEGGALRFPEYSGNLYRPEAGSAAIFSCSLLHEATPVTAGERFVLLSFLYGDAEAQLRQQTQAQIVRTGDVPNIPASGRIQPIS